MKITYSKIKGIAFFALALPSLIFSLGFLRWYIGIPVALLIAVAYIFTLRDIKRENVPPHEEKMLSMPFWCLLAVFGVTFVWCYFGGLGNLWYQSDDWSARNAIFRDLISHAWPVIYSSKNVALVYYIGFWLPPALIGKLIFLMHGNLEVAFFVGNICLWLWSAFCILIAFILTALFINANTKKRLFLALAVFILFSGLDIVGALYNFFFKNISIGSHIEWWSTYYQFSSMTTLLFWVFNQAIMTWLTVACFINEKSTRSYAFLVVLSAASAPIPCVGIAVYMLGFASYKLYLALRAKKGALFWLDVLTPQNLIPVFTLLPIYLAFYKTNLPVNVGREIQSVRREVDIGAVIILAGVFFAVSITAFAFAKKKSPWGEWLILSIMTAVFLVATICDTSIRINYVFAIFLEGIIFLIPLWSEYRRTPIFHTTLFLIMLSPTVRIGTAADFCMRASIPAIFVLMALCLKYLYSHGAKIFSHASKNRSLLLAKISCWALIGCITVGALTPFVEFKRGIDEVIKNKRIVLVNDTTYTFDRIFVGEELYLDRNFIAESYESTFFFRYLAK